MTEAVKVELLPCPFCGGAAVMRRDDDPGYPWYVTFEHEKLCQLYAMPTDLFPAYATEAEAITAWNTRLASQRDPHAVEQLAQVADPVADESIMGCLLCGGDGCEGNRYCRQCGGEGKIRLIDAALSTPPQPVRGDARLRMPGI